MYELATLKPFKVSQPITSKVSAEPKQIYHSSISSSIASKHLVDINLEDQLSGNIINAPSPQQDQIFELEMFTNTISQEPKSTLSPKKQLSSLKLAQSSAFKTEMKKSSLQSTEVNHVKCMQKFVAKEKLFNEKILKDYIMQDKQTLFLPLSDADVCNKSKQLNILSSSESKNGTSIISKVNQHQQQQQQKQQQQQQQEKLISRESQRFFLQVDSSRKSQLQKNMKQRNDNANTLKHSNNIGQSEEAQLRMFGSGPNALWSSVVSQYLSSQIRQSDLDKSLSTSNQTIQKSMENQESTSDVQQLKLEEFHDQELHKSNSEIVRQYFKNVKSESFLTNMIISKENKPLTETKTK
ncbi:myb-like protein P [Copidosoma floridanum]|uniref:myb-like protein P n=1 Tax=Copidosoma floridanum TaxID=29053 RepID=UPI0006C9AAFC|nr:myb-like protein P [Copidosoma floridanum]